MQAMKSCVAAAAVVTVWMATGVAAAGEITVNPGESIQEAIGKAAPGDTILIMPGEYHEALHVDKAQLTMRGVIVDGKWPRLEGRGVLNDGIIGSQSGFTVENLVIANYKANGVTTQGADNVVMRHLIVERTGIYGIYPTLGRNILIEDNVVVGIADAGIYVGMCEHVDVRRNVLYENVAGIEIENSVQVLVEANSAYDNTAGILVFALPQLPKKKVEDVIVRGNFVYDNNHRNFGDVGSVVANVPPGVGILLLAADKTVIEANVVRGNTLAGIVIANHEVIPGLAKDPDVDPSPDDNEVLNNVLYDNGRQTIGSLFWWYHYIGRNLLGGGSPEGTADDLLPKGADFVVAGKGQRNCASDLKSMSRRDADDVTQCAPARTTADVRTKLSAGTMERTFADLGEEVNAVVCAGCHAPTFRLIGPPIAEIREKYKDNPQGIVAFAAAPTKVRDGFPPMPPQTHLGAEKLEAVARFFLK